MDRVLKLLIIDDEYLVRMGLRETIDWEHYGFVISGEAASSTEGYEKFLNLSPDIIITDIRMGSTNGLDLVEKIHNQNKDTEMVILSGYGQFDYAKKAYENGACAFLSKPIKNEELIKTMLAIKDKIEQRETLNAHINELTSQMPYLRNTFINAMLEGAISDDKIISKKCLHYGIKVPNGNFVVASLHIDHNGNSQDNNRQKLTELMLETIEYAITTYKFEAFFSTIKKGDAAIVILRRQEHICMDNFTTKDFLLSIQSEFNDISKNTLTVGVSSPQKEVKNIKVAYAQSKEALKYKAIMGNNSYIEHSVICSHEITNVFISNDDIDAIIKSVKDVNYDKTMLIVDGFFRNINVQKNVNLDNVKNIIAEMIVMIMRSLFKNNDTMIAIFTRILEPYTEVQDFETIDDIEKWVKWFFNKLYEDPNLYLEYTYHPEIQQALVIIMKDYMKPLTVESVANKLFLSQYYFMHLFKEEVGQTFNEFLTKRRIDAAIELIKAGQYKMYEICELVGYKNTNYFAKIFKQIVGVSPKNYTKQKAITKTL